MFIAYDERSMIWGAGKTADEALADAKTVDLWGVLADGTVVMFDGGTARPLTVARCSTKLLRDLDEIGGAVRWVLVEGIAHSMVPEWDDGLPVEAQVN
jgi:hypothetical protein